VQRDALREWLKRQPFQPFRVHVADGRRYDIRFPRMNLLAQTFIKIGIPAPDIPSDIVGDHTEFVRLKDIIRVEPLLSETISSFFIFEGQATIAPKRICRQQSRQE
jgi:hypothetical protein